MPHLSELHGAATHLAVIAVPAYVILLLCRRAEIADAALTIIEPWVVGAAVVGVTLAGATGLLVWGQAQTILRDGAFRLGTLHFWLGIALTLVVFAVAAWRFRFARADRHTHRWSLVFGGLVALVAVLVQGFVGGRMTYDQGVGVYDAGQYAKSASGASQLHVDLANGTPAVRAGARAFSSAGLGCEECHGDQAQGLRGPALAGGRGLDDFRHVHGHGLFPPSVVTDRDFAVINAYLKTLRPRGGRQD